METGDKFKLSKAALENYGETYRDKVFTVKSWANKYVPAKEYFANTKRYPHGHPGYDNCGDTSGKMRLYSSELNCDLYDWETIPL